MRISDANIFGRTAHRLAAILSGLMGSGVFERRQNFRPTERSKRTLDDPAQAARHLAAQHRRDARGKKAQSDFDRCIGNNPCRNKFTHP